MTFSLKSLIVCEKIKFRWFFRDYRLYGRESNVSSPESVKDINSYCVVKEDIFSASDYRKCDHEASCIEDELSGELILDKKINFLSEWGGDNYAKYVIGTQIIGEAKSVLMTFRYAEKVYSEYALTGDVYVMPEMFSLDIYKKIRAMGLLPAHIKIHPLFKLYNYIYHFSKNTYFFVKLLFFPEVVLLKTKDKDIGGEFVSCVYLDDGLIQLNEERSEKFKDDNIIKLFDKDSTVFLNTEKTKSHWVDNAMDDDFHTLHLDDLLASVSKKHFIKNIYKDIFLWRLRLIGLSALNFRLARTSFRLVYERMRWEMFYQKFSASNVIRLMVKEDITSSVVHRKNNTKTIFVYLSSTVSVVDKLIEEGKSSCHDYTHMISDYVVSSKLSNQWLSTHENNIGSYKNIGPLFSDLIHKSRLNKKDIINYLEIPSNSSIISFFDHTVGHIGVLTISAYIAFLDSMVNLASKNTDKYFLFKSKKSLGQLEKIYDGELLHSINKIKSMSNCIYVNDFHLDSFSTMAISDIVVSAPMSSIIFESLCGGVKTIVYDPLNQYGEYKILTQELKSILASSHEVLERLVNYWLTSSTESEFQTYFSTYICPHLDGKCNSNAINEFKGFLRVIS